VRGRVLSVAEIQAFFALREGDPQAVWGADARSLRAALECRQEALEEARERAWEAAEARAWEVAEAEAPARPRGWGGWLVCVVCVVGLFFGLCGQAVATKVAECKTCAPWWHLTSSVRPAVIASEGEGLLVVDAVNVGDARTSGAVTVRDVLPAGVSVVEEGGVPDVFFTAFWAAGGKSNFGSEDCHVAGGVVTCTLPLDPEENEPPLYSFENIEMRVKVKVGGSSARNSVEVSGGGAPPASLAAEIPVGPGPVTFGVERFEQVPEEEGGEIDAQAGSHPFQLTTTVAFNQTSNPIGPPALPRNLTFQLPAGLIGNTTALPQCSEEDFHKIDSVRNHCPEDTAVGVVEITVDEPNFLGLTTEPLPIFNLVPARGEPARFGFTVVKTPVTLDTSVRTGRDYGVTVHVNDISEVVNFFSTSATFWGNPSDPRHEEGRGWGCLVTQNGQGYSGIEEPCEPSQASTVPFLTMPTSCSSPFIARMEGVSWPVETGHDVTHTETLAPEEYRLQNEFGEGLGVTGCNKLSFGPEIEVAPDVRDASTPSGMKVDVRVPQEVSENPGGLASSAVRDIAVRFPEGVTVNPASADGLEACSEGQVGFTEVAPVGSELAGSDLFTPTLGESFCPDASKIGTVKIKVPVIAHPLEGALYVASQNANPFGSLIASYIIAEDPVSGVLVKLAGKVALDPETGRVTATFENSPQAPLEEAEIHLYGGARAPFSTPALCRANKTEATFTPWSGGAPTTAASTFQTTSGPNGSGCPDGSLPFSPTLTSGTTNINAGSFSPLSTTISREDGNQNIQAVTLHYPPGLSGILTGVKLCPEEQANAGTCSQESLIGHTIVSVGLGNEPYSVTGGQVFLTEKYDGAPFGLSIVNPAKAGPFDLEHDTANPSQDPACDCLVVRAKLELNPYTTALSVTTTNIPHIIDGVPLQIKHINVLIEREGFTTNPTNCNPMTITGAITSVENTTANVQVPFQATNCQDLKFAPKLQITTQAHTSKQDGASLTAKLTFPPAPHGTYANIAKVKVDLPKALPSRLTTLQKACLAAVFETNPANCPPASIIGHAKAITPVLPVPLTGPVYFVSHGGEAFPTLTIVLQGYGITVDVTAQTFIHKGITSSTFNATPDQPVNTFELTLPEGPYSALAANTNLCTHQKQLNMPTRYNAQNGDEITTTNKITVTGCPKHNKTHHTKNKQHHNKKNERVSHEGVPLTV
jgi:hypothetical protein